MTVLVTGASGFLGGRLAQLLVERGQRVRVLARPTSDLRTLHGYDVEVARGSLEDPDSLSRAVAGVEVVYHCAALSADWAPWPEFYAANVAGVEHLLQAVQGAGTVRRFVHVSTTDVYGYPKVPCPESYGIHDAGLPYNRSKGMGERAVWEFSERTGLPVTVVRPASIYGPRSKDFVAAFARLLEAGSMILVSGGRSPAGLLYVDNAAQAMIDAAASERTVGQAYNLRDETCETWREYLFDLADGIGARRPRLSIPEPLALATGRAMEHLWRVFRLRSRPLLTRHVVLLLCRDQSYPIDRARSDFAFRSSVSYAEGLRRCTEWLRSAEGREAVARG